ncbi:DNA phosphorothioation-dependent restriction protein DptF [Paenisporosarcina sp. OV554]|uniref:DNA phosphorothioation-dependent restriction protein DptF n=1 Tax=Paenisporosarcina sp. OV554 TaxID=2135694 RepID=UPI000D3B1F10|nr:DNA phosphorothioation-dependent restriction protein DptF [Paenisporosarcina sp. OV554]PUB13377.1 DNA phosphorothioation-dependent restriction protein DptF [Paenisporosarcina sp. OV554]
MYDIDIWNQIVTDNNYDKENYGYNKMIQQIETSPSAAVAKMELIFKNLSFERMKQISFSLKKESLSIRFFDLNKMRYVWEEMRINYQLSDIEYKKVLNFISLAERKFKREISVREAEIAMSILIFIAKQSFEWKEINTLSNGVSNSEVAASIVDNEESTSNEVYEKLIDENKNFMKALTVLQSSSKESVVNADSFGQFRSYMHVERSIETEILSVLESAQKKNAPSLIMLCGSVGDGKSHLLAYIKENRPELLSNFSVHNDSTESYDPKKTSLETLERVLSEFDDNITPSKSSLIAINLGVLHNFYNQQRSNGKFGELCNFIDRSEVFHQSGNAFQEDSQFKLLNFAELQPFTLESNGPNSEFFLNIINKITDNHPLNPFYNAWMKDKENGISTVIHQNYSLLCNPKIKHSIVQILIEAMVKEKIFISTRSFYNFIYEIIVPVNEITQTQSNFDLIKNSLPNLLFAHPDRSQLLKALSELDPLKNRSSQKDEMITEFLLSQNKQSFINDKFKAIENQNSGIPNIEGISKENYLEVTKLLIRQTSLLSDYESNESYREFISYLFAYYTGDGDKISVLFDLLKDVVFSWNGSPMEGYIFTGSTNKEFNIAVPVHLVEDVDETIFGSMNGKESIERFNPYLKVGFNQDKRYFFELDFALFSLLKKIRKGYRPNKQDIQNALQFNELHEKIIKSAEKNNKILLLHKKTNAMYEVSKPRFSNAKFEMKKV